MRLQLVMLGMSMGLAAAVPMAAWAQAAPIARIMVADGIQLDVSMTGVAPASGLLESRAEVRDGELYRMIVDGEGLVRFAYALRLEPRAGAVELMFRPVRLHEALGAFAPRQRTYVLPFRLDSGLATLSEIQRSGPLRPGDTVTLDLFEDRAGQRISDVVTLTSASEAAVAQLAELRMRRQDNRPVLTVAGMTIVRAGHVLHVDRPGTLATGHAVGLGLGDEMGAVFFSAEPPQASVPYGVATVDGNVLRFTLDGVEYECRGSEPVGPPGLSSVWMYVRREPLPYVQGFFTTASDTVDVWMQLGRDTP